ncbi:MAG: ABC transporter permease, partial [Fusobacteriaceae bacterium]
MKQIFKNKQLAIILSMVLLILFFSLTSSYFFTLNNFLTIGLQTSVIGIISLGMTYVIITGGIDLSVGSILAFSGIVTGYLLNIGQNVVLSILCGLLAGTMMGIFNGLLVTKGKLPPFIATLGTMMSVRGLTLALTNGMPISGLPDSFEMFSGGTVFNVPNPLIYLVILSIVVGFVLKN